MKDIKIRINSEEHSKKKKFGILIRDGYLVAVDENSHAVVDNLLDARAKGKLELCGYDTSAYKWNDDGSLK